MNEVMKALIGQVVRVWSVGDQQHTDDGTLEAYDLPWLRLRKANGEILCFSVYQVRLIKPLSKADLDDHVVAV